MKLDEAVTALHILTHGKGSPLRKCSSPDAECVRLHIWDLLCEHNERQMREYNARLQDQGAEAWH